MFHIQFFLKLFSNFKFICFLLLHEIVKIIFKIFIIVIFIPIQKFVYKLLNFTHFKNIQLFEIYSNKKIILKYDVIKYQYNLWIFFLLTTLKQF